MDEKDKKPGASGGRDISDLKARLGLKKGDGGAAASAPNPIPSAGVPAPVPVPPGFGPVETAPAPVAAAIAVAAEAPADDVDARRDPFAMAAPAMPPGYYGYALPGADDGKPAEAINKPQPWGRLIITGVTVLVLFVAGFTLGKIQWARANMNHTIDQAADIKVEVDRMSKVLNSINEKVGGSQEAAKNNPDTGLAADLAMLDLKKPETEKIFKTNYYYLDDLSVDLLFNYYNDTILLYNLINTHAKKTEADKEAIENFVKQAKAGDKNYGVTVDTSGPIPLAHLAEMGSPVCPTDGDVNCSATDLKGFKFRTEAGKEFTQKPIKGAMNAIIIPLQKTPLSTGAMAGNADLLAAKDCLRRQNDIRGITGKLFGEQKELLNKLEMAADRKRKVPEYIVF